MTWDSRAPGSWWRGRGSPTTLVTDSFTRADNPLSMGNTEGGTLSPLAWTPNSDTWRIIGNQAGATVGNQASTVVSTGRSDGTVQVTMATAGDAGLCWRSTDDSNYWVSSQTNVYKRVAGTFTSMAGPFAGIASGDVTKVVLAGNVHSFYKNGVLVASFSDAFNAGATKHGLRDGSFTIARFDDFLVTQ